MSNIFSDLFKKKAAPSNGQPLPFQLIWTGTGFSMVPYATMTYIKQGYNGNAAVYSIINALMDKFVQVPFYLYKVKDEKKLRQYKTMTGKAYHPGAMLTKIAAMDEMDDSHAISQLMHKPNTYQTESDFWKMAILFLKTTGLAPIYANTGLVGTKPLSLHVLPSQWLTLEPDATLMDAAKVSFSPMGAGVNPLERKKVYIWKYINPDFQTDGSHLYGLSPLRAGLLDMQGSNEAAKQMAKMYQNGGARGAMTPKEIIGEKQVSQFRTAIENWLTGSENKGKVGGLSFPVEFHDIGLTSVDMELLKGRQMTDERIASLFNYPPALLRSDNKYDNADAAVKYVVTNSLYGDLTSKRDILNQWLLPMMGENSGSYYIDFDISILPEMQGDMEKIVNQAAKMWYLTPNEMRQLSRYGNIMKPAMDLVYIPTGLTPIDDMLMADLPLTEDYDTPQS